MKQVILTLLALSLLCSGCSITLMGRNSDQIPYETFDTKPQPEDPAKMILYKRAMEALANMEYAKALELFTELGNYKDAAAYCSRFTYIEDTLLRTEQYTNGVFTNETVAQYNPAGELLETSAGGFRTSYLLDENGSLEAETWQYKDYLLVKCYNTYDHVGTLRSEQKRPLFATNGTTETKEGYYISYAYNSQGLPISDEGELQQHIRVDDSIQVKHLRFKGQYTYNDAGKLLRYDREFNWGVSGKEWTVYEYDATGNVIREEKRKEGAVFFIESTPSDSGYRTERGIKEYRYDEDGNLVLFSQATTISAPGQDAETQYIQIQYEYDNGRLVMETTTFGDNSDTVIETCYIYGDYLGYLTGEES